MSNEPAQPGATDPVPKLGFILLAVGLGGLLIAGTNLPVVTGAFVDADVTGVLLSTGTQKGTVVLCMLWIFVYGKWHGTNWARRILWWGLFLVSLSLVVTGGFVWIAKVDYVLFMLAEQTGLQAEAQQDFRILNSNNPWARQYKAALAEQLDVWHVTLVGIAALLTVTWFGYILTLNEDD